MVVENLHMLLSDQLSDDDGWALRHTLLNESRIMLVASAVSRFAQVEIEGKPMFELFRFLELKPLDEQECRQLWASVTGKKVDDVRVRPLQILTGGNPRLLAIVATFAANMSLKDLMKDLIKLVDEHTEYFKCHLDNLAPMERKVYIALAEIWDPASAREVADAARLDVNKTSSFLARLIERGAVVEANGKARSKLYQVAERMYNIYHLMRHHGVPSTRIKAIVNFMVSFYGPEELVGAVKSIAEEACKLAPAERMEHYVAYEGIVDQVQDAATIYKIVQNTPRTFFESPDIPISLKNLFETTVPSDADKHLNEVFEKYESITNDPKRLKKEEKYFRDFVRDHPQNYMGLLRLGSFLRTCLHRFEEAEKIYREAIKIEPKRDVGWFCLSGLLLECGRYDEAEQAYFKATEMPPKDKPPYWMAFGLLCQEKQCFDMAARVYRKEVEINSQNAAAWKKLGLLLGRDLKQYNEAVKALQKAIKLNPKDGASWNNLGLALENIGKFEEAEKAFREALRLKDKPANTLASLGVLLILMGRVREGEECFREAIKKDPKCDRAIIALCLLLILDPSRKDEGWKLLQELVRNPEIPTKNIELATELIVGFAVMGYAQEALGILKESLWAETLEPVVVALRLILGEDVKAAAEIMEVAKDVVKRIEKQREEMKATTKSQTKK